MSSCEFDMLRRCGARYVLLLRLCVSHFKLRRRSDYKLPGRRRRRGEEEEEARVDSSIGGKRRRHKKGGGRGVFTSFLGSPRGLKQWRKGEEGVHTQNGEEEKRSVSWDEDSPIHHIISSVICQHVLWQYMSSEKFKFGESRPFARSTRWQHVHPLTHSTEAQNEGGKRRGRA